MKRLTTLILIMAVLALTGCGLIEGYEVKIVIPAGSTSRYVYTEEEFSPKLNSIIISSGQGLGDTEVVLLPVGGEEGEASAPMYLTPGLPVKLDGEKGKWFRIGVSVQNSGSQDKTVYIKVKDADIRISD